MNQYSIRRALFDYLDTNWTKTDIAWPEMPYEPSGLVPWIRPTLRMNESYEGEVGLNVNAVDFESGALLIQIFVPVTTGALTGEIIAEELRSLLRRQSITVDVTDTLIISNVSITGGDPDPDDPRFHYYLVRANLPINIVCGTM